MNKVCFNWVKCTLLIVGIVIVGMMAGALNVDAATIIDSGNCGNDATWTLNSDGLLTIRGTGSIADYKCNRFSIVHDNPWFNYRSTIKRVVIREGITRIGEDAFCDFSNLEEVSLPTSLKSIERHAITYSEKLQEVTIPDKVTTISYLAFIYCSALETFNIGNNFRFQTDQNIGNDICYQCMSITSINVSKENQYFESVDGVLYTKGKNKLVSYPVGKKRTSFSIPSDVEELEKYAFWGNQYLETITVPTTVKKMGDSAFAKMQALQSLIIKASVDTLPNGLARDCDRLTTVRIPSSVKKIGEKAFLRCTQLRDINLDYHVDLIGYDAFRYTNINSYQKWMHGSIENEIDWERKYTVTAAGTVSLEKIDQALKIINAERKKKGLGSLQLDKDLQDKAIELAMEETLAYMSRYYLTGEKRDHGEYVIPLSNASDNSGKLWDAEYALKMIMANPPEKWGDILNGNYNCIGIAGFKRDGKTEMPMAWGFVFGYTKADSPEVRDSATYRDTVSSSYIDRMVDKYNSISVLEADRIKYVLEGKTINAPRVDMNLTFVHLNKTAYPHSYTSIPQWWSGDSSAASMDSSRTKIKGIKAGKTVTLSTKIGGKIISAKVKVEKKLATPVLSAVSNKVSGVNVSWNSVSGASRYRVYRKVSGGSWAKLADTTVCEYYDKTAKSGTRYWYTVRCLNSVGKITVSDYDEQGLGIRYLAAVQPTLTNYSSGINLQWNTMRNSKGYYIYRQQLDGSMKRIHTITDGTKCSWTDTTPAELDGDMIVYAVRAFNGDDKASYIRSSILRISTPKLTAVTSTVPGKVKMRWDTASDVEGFEIKYATDSSFASGSKTISISEGEKTSYTISGLISDKKYWVKIRSVQTADGVKYHSGWSSSCSITVAG